MLRWGSVMMSSVRVWSDVYDVDRHYDNSSYLIQVTSQTGRWHHYRECVSYAFKLGWVSHCIHSSNEFPPDIWSLFCERFREVYARLAEGFLNCHLHIEFMRSTMSA